MAKFIEIDSGWINLDHVAKVRREKRRAHDHAELFFGPNDTLLGEKFIPGRHFTEFGEITAAYVQAAPNEHAVAIFGEWEDDGPITLNIYYPKIIAWRIADWVQPVFLESDIFEESARNPRLQVFLRAEKNDIHSLMIPAHGYFDDLEAAKAEALSQFEQVRAVWHAKAAKTKPVTDTVTDSVTD